MPTCISHTAAKPDVIDAEQNDPVTDFGFTLPMGLIGMDKNMSLVGTSQNDSDNGSETPVIESSSCEEETSDMQEHCNDLALAKRGLNDFMEKNEAVFKRAKTLRNLVKECRSGLMNTMEEKGLSEFVDEEGNTFQFKKRKFCAVSHKKMTETLDASAVDTYERKYTEERPVMTIKKPRN